MCQNYVHSDSTLDLIINWTRPVTTRLPVRCKEQKSVAESKVFKVIACKSSNLMRNVWVCLEMNAHQSVFRWGWWLCLMWWHLHTCAAICAPAPSVTAVPPGRQQVSWWTRLTLLSSGRMTPRLWVVCASDWTEEKQKLLWEIVWNFGKYAHCLSCQGLEIHLPAPLKPLTI